MKKLNSLYVAVALTAVGSSAFAADVRIDIDGLVTTTTCRVEDENTGKHLTSLTLDPVSKLALAAAGEVAGQKEFQLNISKCEDSVKTVNVSFDNRENFSSAGRLVNKATATGTNDDTDAAKNVEIQVMDAQRNAVLNLSTDKPEFAIASGAGVVPLAFRYYATGTATAGRVETVLELSMHYN